MISFAIFCFILLIHIAPVAIAGVRYVLLYGYNCPCESTIYYGLAVPMSWKHTPEYTYWCPLGIIAITMEILDK